MSLIPKKAVAVTQEKIIDATRMHFLSILFSAFEMTLDEVIIALNGLKHEMITILIIEKLEKIKPTQEEMEKLKRMEPSCSVEQFLKEISQITLVD